MGSDIEGGGVSFLLLHLLVLSNCSRLVGGYCVASIPYNDVPVLFPAQQVVHLRIYIYSLRYLGVDSMCG